MRPMEPMRPMLLIFLLGLLVMAGCSGGGSEDDPVEVMDNQVAIAFSGNLPEDNVVTRAGAGLETMLTDKTFQVWGFKNDAYESGSYPSYQTVMPGFMVNWMSNSANTTTSNTDDWEYVGQGATAAQQAEQTIKYWDFNAKGYRFFGATNWKGEDTGGSLEANKTYGAFGAYSTYGANSAYVVLAAVDAGTDAGVTAAPYFSDLWFSNGNTVDYPERRYGKAVQLQFLKPFAKVRFIFTFANGLTFGRESLTNISFHPTETNDIIATAGTVSVSYPLKGTATTESWSTSGTTGPSQFDIDYYEEPHPAVAPANAQPTTWPNSPEKWYYVLPASSQGTYTVEVQATAAAPKSAVVPAEYMSWKAGYEYTYKFKITERGGIMFDVLQVAINQWVEKDHTNHPVYNW